MRACNAESQKSSAKGSNFKDDDKALSLDKLLLYAANSGKMLAAHAQLYLIIQYLYQLQPASWNVFVSGGPGYLAEGDGWSGHARGVEGVLHTQGTRSPHTHTHTLLEKYWRILLYVTDLLSVL